MSSPKFCPKCGNETIRCASQPWTSTKRCIECEIDYVTYHGDAMGGSHDVTEAKYRPMKEVSHG